MSETSLAVIAARKRREEMMMLDTDSDYRYTPHHRSTSTASSGHSITRSQPGTKRKTLSAGGLAVQTPHTGMADHWPSRSRYAMLQRWENRVLKHEQQVACRSASDTAAGDRVEEHQQPPTPTAAQGAAPQWAIAGGGGRERGPSVTLESPPTDDEGKPPSGKELAASPAASPSRGLGLGLGSPCRRTPTAGTSASLGTGIAPVLPTPFPFGIGGSRAPEAANDRAHVRGAVPIEEREEVRVEFSRESDPPLFYSYKYSDTTGTAESQTQCSFDRHHAAELYRHQGTEQLPPSSPSLLSTAPSPHRRATPQFIQEKENITVTGTESARRRRGGKTMMSKKMKTKEIGSGGSGFLPRSIDEVEQLLFVPHCHCHGDRNRKDTAERQEEGTDTPSRHMGRVPVRWPKVCSLLQMRETTNSSPSSSRCGGGPSTRRHAPAVVHQVAMSGPSCGVRPTVVTTRGGSGSGGALMNTGLMAVSHAGRGQQTVPHVPVNVPTSISVNLLSSPQASAGNASLCRTPCSRTACQARGKTTGTPKGTEKTRTSTPSRCGYPVSPAQLSKEWLEHGLRPPADRYSTRGQRELKWNSSL